ncbi:MAG: hypothetical protein GWN16_16135 [Calditrichae bacterium]|nr:hypothetical protein [Calditrichia bacterium]
MVVENLAHPKKSRNFLDGSTRSEAELHSAKIGLGIYQAGWKWTLHAGAQTGKSSENHIGYIISGHMIIQDAIGAQREVGSGDAFEIGPGHDAWVLGNTPCIALDFTHISE